MAGKKRSRKDDYPGEGYRRAKRSLHPRRLRVGSHVIFEDGDTGRVHRRAFLITGLGRTTAVIKGWPDGHPKSKPAVTLEVSRREVVDAQQVLDEEFKAAFDTPEDTKRTRYDYVIIGVTAKRRKRRK